MTSGRRMSRRAPALVTGVVVSAALFFSPVADRFARTTLPPMSGKPGSVRQLYYAGSNEALRDADTYTLAHENAPAGNKDLVLMGSSELSSSVPQNPDRFLLNRVTDFDLYMDGRGYTQSLYHAIELAAIADQLPSKRVAMIVSPQWFSEKGASAESFQEVFSTAQLQGLNDNPRLSQATREAIMRRAGKFVGNPVWFPPTTGRRDTVLNAFNVPDQLQRRADVLKIASEAARATSTLYQPYRIGAGAVPAAQIDWQAERMAAELQGKAAVSNNEFSVADSYFDTYMHGRLGELLGDLKDADFAGPSPEWSDLDLFLQVAHENNIQVLLISVPMNGRWYDFAGYPAARRSRYYSKVRAVAERWGAQLADLSANEYEPYYLYDTMHLGWKGWLDVTEACIRFANA